MDSSSTVLFCAFVCTVRLFFSGYIRNGFFLLFLCYQLFLRLFCSVYSVYDYIYRFYYRSCILSVFLCYTIVTWKYWFFWVYFCSVLCELINSKKEQIQCKVIIASLLNIINKILFIRY